MRSRKIRDAEKAAIEAEGICRGSCSRTGGPLSDFNSTILVAEGFDVVTGPIAGELQMTRAARIAFAHAKHTFTFEQSAIEKKARGSSDADRDGQGASCFRL